MESDIPRTSDRPRPARALARACACALAAAAMMLVAVAPAHAAVYDPLNIISYETWRASTSLSVADIQAFLETQPGPLKSLVTTDYVNVGGDHGTPWVKGQPAKSAAQIIAEASLFWNINPKVILATIQKEQSLIEVSNSANGSRYVKAMGCGVYDNDGDGKIENQFPGFGAQIYNGARVFSQYETIYHWVPGMTKRVEVSATHAKITIVPFNACTFGLYTYTPYYPQISFWNIYVRYFGDPLAPPRLRPVYRFRNRSNGTYYYTASEAKRYTMIRTAHHTWLFAGVSFTVDTSAATNVTPLYRMYNSHTHKFAYTTSGAKRDQLLRVRPKQWRYDGAVCSVSLESSGTAPVFQLERKTTHGVLYTSSASEKAGLTSGHGAAYYYRGAPFRLDVSVVTTVPVGPAP
jgi:hypothetical protein